MEKDFDGWNIEKKKINHRNTTILFHEREVWWSSLGLNVGSEQDGKNRFFERPVLVIKKFNQEILWIMPLTQSNKFGKHYYQLTNGSVVILSQLKLISSRRLLRKISALSEYDFKNIIKKVKNLFPKV